MSIGEKISYYRKKKGLTQEDLADKLEVSRQTIYKWEANRAFPELKKLHKITEVLSIDFNELLNWEEKQNAK